MVLPPGALWTTVFPLGAFQLSIESASPRRSNNWRVQSMGVGEVRARMRAFAGTSCTDMSGIPLLSYRRALVLFPGVNSVTCLSARMPSAAATRIRHTAIVVLLQNAGDMH